MEYVTNPDARMLLTAEANMQKNSPGDSAHSIPYRTIFLLIILFLLAGSLRIFQVYIPSEISAPVPRDYAEYRLNYTVLMRNEDSDRHISGKLCLPVPNSSYPYQQVENVVIEPEPPDIRRDSEGNTVCILPIELDTLQEKSVTVSFDVTVYHVSFPLCSEGNGDLPPLTSRYLVSDGVFRADIPEIKAIAGRLSENEPAGYYRLVRLYDYVRKNYIFRESLHPRALQEVLRDGVVQCGDVNVLFVALCRASGIPAQFVGGVYVSRDRVVFPQTHSWVRAYLKGIGWVPIDPTLGRFDDRSRFLCFGEQRRFYIEMWKGSSEPAVFEPSDANMPGPALYLKMDLHPHAWEKKIESAVVPPVRLPAGKVPDGSIHEKYSAVSFSHYSDGQKLERSGNFDGALAEFENAVRLSPEFVRAHNELIRCSFLAGRGDPAFLRYKAAFDASPGNTLAKYYYALCLIQKQYYSEAEKKLRECEREGFTSTELYNSLGYMYLVTKQISRAEETFKIALCARGNHFAVYANLMSMLQDGEEWERMIRWAEKALEEFPDNQLFLAQIGFALIETGRPGEALTYISRAVEKDREMGWYYALKGWAQRDLGDREGARQSLRKALELKKGIGYFKYYEDMLKELEE